MLDIYGQLRFLIIDDFPQFRQAMKQMVESFGAQSIELVPSAEAALKELQKRPFDVILADYNLGSRKNGQQLLEEARHLKLLKNAHIFIMVTAETTTDMVLGALEYQPDDYLTKPFNKTMLKTRLDRILERKMEFIDIHREADRGNLRAAIAACDQMLKTRTRNQLLCLKIRGELCLELGEYAQAGQSFEQVLAVRRLPWAILNRAKVHFYNQEYAQAKTVFRELLAINESYVTAYDWLAMIDEAEGRPLDAQMKLAAAARLSPRHLQRQVRLGQLALNNQDLEQAELAYRHTVNLGRFSCHNQPDNYLNLARVLLAKTKGDSLAESERLLKEALHTMSEVRELFSESGEVAAASRILDSQAYLRLGKTKEAQTALNMAVDLHARFGHEMQAASVDELVSLLKDTGQIRLLDQVQKEQELFAENKLSAASSNAGENSNLNQKGIKLYQQGQLDEAMKCFERACQEQPSNLGIHLNALQVCMKLLELPTTQQAEWLARAKLYYNAIEHLVALGQQSDRYDKMKTIYQQMIHLPHRD